MIERLQAQALNCIFGWKIPYTEMRQRVGVPTLRQRRILLTDKFAEKAAASARFSKWFLKRKVVRAASRVKEMYLETFVRCERLRNSPVHYMQRRLNGKLGKTYGERNKQYRDTDDGSIKLKSLKNRHRVWMGNRTLDFDCSTELDLKLDQSCTGLRTLL